MAATCPVGFDVERLRGQILATYDRVAREPHGEFHFHRGPRYAAEFLEYDGAELALLPVESTARFAGGLRDGAIYERFDCFRDTSAEAKVAKDLRVHAVNFFARKPYRD